MARAIHAGFVLIRIVYSFKNFTYMTFVKKEYYKQHIIM